MLYTVITIVLAYCSMIYELVFSQFFTVMYGNSLNSYSITVGLYLFFLGVGSFLLDIIVTKSDKIKLFYIVELIIAFSAIAAPILMLQLYINGYYILAKIVGYFFMMLIAIASGMEIPLLTELSKKRFGFILSVDYFGSLIATLALPYILAPYLNLFNAIALTATVNLLVVLVMLYIKKERNTFWYIVVGLLLVASLKIIKDRPYEKMIQERYALESVKVLDSSYQSILDVKKKGDRCIYLDFMPQICYSWIDGYNQGLLKPLDFIDKREVDILLIGSGDMTIFKYLSDHLEISKKISSIDMIEIDPAIVKYSLDSFLPREDSEKVRKFIKDHNVTIYYSDIIPVLNSRRLKQKYDLVVIDLPVPNEYRIYRFFSQEILASLRKHMNRDAFISILDSDLDSEFLAACLQPVIKYNIEKENYYDEFVVYQKKKDCKIDINYRRHNNLLFKPALNYIQSQQKEKELFLKEFR